MTLDNAIRLLTFLVGVALLVVELWVHDPSRPTVVILSLVLVGVITGDQVRRLIEHQAHTPPPKGESDDSATG